MPNYMRKPLISILLPVKNASLYLADCIDSIIKQTETNWELIAVEDHSDDDSFKILKAYEQKEQRIKVLKNNGKGIIPALRKAYENSIGELITRMDADDIMVPTKLEKLKACLSDFGTGHLSIGLVQYFSKNALGNGYLKYQNWLNALSLQEHNYYDIYKECVVPSPCWMIYRKDLDQCKAFKPDIYPEDYDLCFRFYKNDIKIKTVKEVLHHWRDYPERTSRNDPNYRDVHFFDLKIKCFLQLDYDPERPLILSGAGKKGKELARILINKNISFQWLTNNPQKIGHNIYGIKLKSELHLKNITNPQIIISIAAPDARHAIQKNLDQLHFEKAQDYFFFC